MRGPVAVRQTSFTLHLSPPMHARAHESDLQASYAPQVSACMPHMPAKQASELLISFGSVGERGGCLL